MEKIIKKLASIKLTVFTLTLLILLFFTGVYIPQINTLPEISRYSPELFYKKNFGGFIGSAITAFNFNDVFHSYLFFILLFLLIINLLCCTLQKRLTIITLGFYLTHISIIFIITGFIVSGIYFDSGALWLKEGQSAKNYISRKTGIKKQLPFSILLKKFSLAHSPKSSFGTLNVLLKNRNKKFIIDAKINNIWQNIPNSSYKIKIHAFYPDLNFDFQNKPYSISDKPMNPALVIGLKKDDISETRYLFSKFPALNNSVIFEDVQALFNYHRHIEQFVSEVVINNSTILSTIKVNSPASYKNYKIYQFSYNPDDLSLTCLEIVKDPGLYIVYTGFIMIMAGIIYIFYVKPVILKRYGNQYEN